MNILPVITLSERWLGYKAKILPRLLWIAADAQQALGAWGLLALFLLAAALGTQLGVIAPGSKSIELRREQAQNGIDAKPDAVQNKVPIQLHRLPTTDTFDHRLEAILSILQNNRFLIHETSFRYARVDENRLQRLEVDIPMFGSYMMLHEALPLLQQQPAVRVETISVERKSIGDTAAYVRLKLSLLGVHK